MAFRLSFLSIDFKLFGAMGVPIFVGFGRIYFSHFFFFLLSDFESYQFLVVLRELNF